MNKQWLSLTLGIMTATGGFLDAGTIATAGAAGATFGLGLIWAVVVATVAVILLVDMVGRFTAVSQHTYGDAIRESFGFKFYLFPLISEVVAEALLLAAEIGGVAIAMSLITGINWRLLYFVAALLVWITVWRAPFGFIENAPALFGLTVLSLLVAVVALGGIGPGTLPTLWAPDFKQGAPAEYLYLVAAILGATISPYLLYFYSSGAIEEKWNRGSLLINNVTAVAGMSFGAAGQIALIVLTAVVLGPLNIGAATLGEIGLPMAQAFGPVGTILFAVVLFTTCFGAALEVVLAVSFLIAQGFGWEWGEDRPPAQAGRFNLTLTVFLVVAVIVGLLAGDPLQLAVLASIVIALVLPLSLAPFLIIMNDRRYLQDQTNGRWTNIATVAVIVLASLIALVSLPLEIITGGGYVSEQPLLVMRDIVDNQFLTADGIRIGRVADIEAALREDGELVLVNLVAGPEALAGRVAARLRPLFHALLRGRFERRIPVDQVESVGLHVCLRGKATGYELGASDRWIGSHLFRWIPGGR